MNYIADDIGIPNDGGFRMQTSLPEHAYVSPHALFQEIDGQCVLLNLQTEHYYSLDDVGTCMWQLLMEHHRVALVGEQLLDEYDVDRATLYRDLGNLITELVQAGLLTID